MIGIDIGGANLKIVTDNDVFIHYCPLWKRAPLVDLLRPYKDLGDAVVVMSGELADGFSSKEEGINWIINETQKVFPNALFYGTDGKFHKESDRSLAAANWFAMADCFRTIYPDALLVDMGSTTTDIIPLNAYRELLGLTDLARLQQGYLIYLGGLRTPVATLVRKVTVNGLPTPVSTEFFACSGDVHVALKKLDQKMYTSNTPDNRGTDIISCTKRLSRVVCADPEEIDSPLNIASEYLNEEKVIITSAISAALKKHDLKQVICAGICSSLVSEWTGGIDLLKDYGKWSDALPAYAVRELVIKGNKF